MQALITIVSLVFKLLSYDKAIKKNGVQLNNLERF